MLDVWGAFMPLRHDLPFVRPGQSVGLFGGSFDPPHAGHVHISHEALKRFGLDYVWWMVSPGNPLKPNGPAPLARRMAAAGALVRTPKIVVTDVEVCIGTRSTAATIEWLRAAYPGTRFVWIMGADNLVQFHRWQRWDFIMRTVPVGVLARPGVRIAAQTAKAARIFQRAKLPAAKASLLPWSVPPAWCFLNVPMVGMSSTDLRAQGVWAPMDTDLPAQDRIIYT